ncbi:MAG: hypothetical protein P8168_13405 [Deltaproteobacteria bacterium]|jgi:hypothetical protein
MEDVLQAYHLPYDPDYPQVCMDETCKQLTGEVLAPWLVRREDRGGSTMNTSATAWPRSFSQ